MRILHVLPFATRGGIELNCFYLIKATPGNHHEVVVLDSGGPMVEKWRTLAVDVRILDIQQLPILEFRRSLLSLLPSSSFDIVIAWSNNRMPVVMNALRKYDKARVLVHIGNPVDGNFSSLIKLKVQELLWPLHSRIELRAVSSFVQKSIQQNSYYNRFRTKVSLKPIEVKGQGRPPRIISKDSEVSFGMVARLDSIKDHATVVKAFSIITGTYPNATLHFAGDGDEREKISGVAQALNLTSRVIFHGDVADVNRLMSSWDVFLYSTTTKEGLGGTVPEALSVGLPVVASDLPMIREWDSSGRYIRWCNPADPRSMADVTLALIDDIEHRRLVYNSGPAYIRENFSPHGFSIRYLSD